jgi:hypothetical protein
MTAGLANATDSVFALFMECEIVPRDEAGECCDDW